MNKVEQRVSSNNFSQNVEQLAEDKNCSIMEAVIIYCNDRNIELESVPSLCNVRVKKMIENEALELNMITGIKYKKVL